MSALIFCAYLVACVVASTRSTASENHSAAKFDEIELLVDTVLDEVRDINLRNLFAVSLTTFRPKACPAGTTSEPLLFCPTPNSSNLSRWKCVSETELCNGQLDCPNGEDESPTQCLFWKMTRLAIKNARMAKHLRLGGHDSSIGINNNL